MVQEMRKELNDIRKDQNKTSQLSEEDLYVLDPDYNAAIDYNLSGAGSNLNSVIGGNMFSHFQAPRLPQGESFTINNNNNKFFICLNTKMFSIVTI